MKRVLGFFACLTLLIAACGPSGTPTPIGSEPITVETMERLLTGDDIEAVGASADGLDERTEDISETVGLIDPQRMEGIDAWFSRSLTSSARPGVILALRRFVDPATANGQLDSIEHGGAFDAMASPVGDRSALAVGDTPEQGTAIALVEGRTLIVLQCPAASDGTTLLNAGQITDLAQHIADRL